MVTDIVSVCEVCRSRPPLDGGPCRLCRADERLALFGEVTFKLVPGEAPRVVCGAVHPDAYRRAVCALDDRHDGYHATWDGRLQWQVAPPGSKGAVQCVTIDRAKRDHVLTYGEPKADLGAAVARGEARARQVVDETMAALYPAGQLRSAIYGGGTNRHARRKAAKRGWR